MQFVVAADAPALLALVGHHRPLQHAEACPYCRHPRSEWLGPDAVPITDFITEFPQAIVPLLSPANVVYDGLHCCAAVLSALLHCVHLYLRQRRESEDTLTTLITSVVSDWVPTRTRRPVYRPKEERTFYMQGIRKLNFFTAPTGYQAKLLLRSDPFWRDLVDDVLPDERDSDHVAELLDDVRICWYIFWFMISPVCNSSSGYHSWWQNARSGVPGYASAGGRYSRIWSRKMQQFGGPTGGASRCTSF